MRTTPSLLLAVLLLICLMTWGPNAQAQDPIHRCVSAQGQPVFTDQPCAALQATPVTAAAPGPSVQSPAGAPPAPPPILCAANVDELKQSVIDAFAARDANRLAGLMLWGGFGHRAAVADIESLRRAMRQPLLDVQAADEADPTDAQPQNYVPAAAATSANTAAPPAAPVAGRTLILETAGNDGSGAPHQLRFDIIHRAGCLWLGGTG